MKKIMSLTFCFLLGLVFFSSQGICEPTSFNLTFQVYNPLVGPINFQAMQRQYGDVKISLNKLNKFGRAGSEVVIDVDTLKKLLESSYDAAEKKRLTDRARKGIFEIGNLAAGKYLIRFSAREGLQYNDFEQYFEISESGGINGLNSIEGLYRISLDLSLTGKILYYSLICIVFLTFFIGISLIVIQHVAFKDIPFVSLFGSAIVMLSWAVVLGKLPAGVRIPLFMVQFVIYVLVLWKKDLSSMPLPFLTKSYIQSKMDFLFQSGLLLHDLDENSKGIVRIRDKWHNILTMKATRYTGESALSKGTTVYLIDYDEKKDIYFVQSEEELHGLSN